MATLKKREKMLAAATGSLALIFLLNYFVCGEKKPSKSTRRVQPAVESAVVGLAKSLVSAQPVRSRLERTGPLPSDISWGRDPFAETFRLARSDSSAEKVEDFTLRGIIWKGNQAHVLIGDQILREGEESGDLKVLDIQRNKVVCRKADRIITLTLEDNEE